MSVVEGRYKDAAYYYWLLSVQKVAKLASSVSTAA
jgi:hypothetical protein